MERFNVRSYASLIGKATNGEFQAVKPLTAGDGRIMCLFLDVLKYGVIIRQTVCGTEIASCPERTTPGSLSQLKKHHLNFACGRAVQGARLTMSSPSMFYCFTTIPWFINPEQDLRRSLTDEN